MKVLTVVGARPQFVKAAAVSSLLRQEMDEVLLHTGQHYDAAMSQVFFDELGIPAPDLNLQVGSGSHGEQTADMLRGIEAALEAERPDLLLVYGDTNSTLAGALAASKMVIPVAHVEAGLRSYNRAMPEEVNRVLTDHLSRALFCPTETAVENLRREGITDGVVLTGDVMADVLLDTRARPVPEGMPERESYVLATVHRAENTDDDARLAAIFSALDALALPVVMPLHPRTLRRLGEAGITPGENIEIREPVGYREMVALLDGAKLALSDSGGLQKEAFWLGVPCVTLREETEWVETLDGGWNALAGADRGRIIASAEAGFQLGRAGDAHLPPRAVPDIVGHLLAMA